MALTHLFILLLAALGGWAACGLVYRMLLAKQILDLPNERSMHARPVPRGGGLGLWLAVLPLWMAGLLFHGHLASHAGLLAGLLMLIAISWLDDKKSLPASLRLGAHIVAAIIGLSALPETGLVFQGLLPLPIDRALAVFCWVWFINLTNFMDGIDGLSGAEGAHTALAFLLVVSLAGIDIPGASALAAALAGACLGFLFWNWHPARLFMGDVGSIPLGYLLGFLMLALASSGYLLAALAIPLYYLTDATTTLLRRMAEKKKFWQPHREHFYQKAALGAGTPIPVVLAIILANLGLMGTLALAFRLGPMAYLAAPLLIGGLLWYLNRLANSPKA